METVRLIATKLGKPDLVDRLILAGWSPERIRQHVLEEYVSFVSTCRTRLVEAFLESGRRTGISGDEKKLIREALTRDPSGRDVLAFAGQEAGLVIRSILEDGNFFRDS